MELPARRSRFKVAVAAILLLTQLSCDSGLGPNDVATVTVTPGTLTLAVGHGLQLVATAKTADGTVLSDRTVTWLSSDPAVATVDATGVVQPLSAGQASVSATAGGRSGSAALTVITPGGTLQIVSGDVQHVTVTGTLPDPLVVLVRDQAGEARPGIPVTFSLIDGSAELMPDTATTDGTGHASTTMVLGPRAGSNTVVVRAEGVADSITFVEWAEPDVPARLVVASGDGQSTFTGKALLDPVRARVEDQFGNVIPGLDVEWVVTAGGGHPSASTTTTDGAGLATVAWTLGASAGPNTIEARAAGATPAAFSALAVVPGPGTITVSSSDVRFASRLQTLQPDGTGKADIPGSVEGDIDADRSGTRLVFTNFAANAGQPSGFNDYADVVVMNVDGTGRTRLTNHFGSVSGPVWSPDGSKIAFASDQSGQSEIYLMNADGTNLLQLTTGGGYAPSWAPDGSRIAVGRRLALAVPRPNAFVMDVDGGNVVQLIPGEDPAWSPDGTRIALVTCGGACNPVDYQLELINPDGTGETQLAGISGAHEPAWAPDGSRIALQVFSSNGFGDGLWTINPDGAGAVRLDLLPSLPAWGF